MTARQILALLLLAAVLAAMAPCAAARPVCVVGADACCADETAPADSDGQPAGELPGDGDAPCAACDCCAAQRVTAPPPPPPPAGLATAGAIEPGPPPVFIAQAARDIFRPPRLPLA